MPLLRRPAVAAVALLSFAATSADAPGYAGRPVAPSPRVLETVEYYDIGGQSVPSLWQHISARGPRLGSTPWAAHARWDVRWTFDWRAHDGGCRIETASTSLAVTYTLPRWAGRDLADDELKAKWDRFAMALRVHEEGHGANGLRAAARIEVALGELPPRASCEALVRAAEETARRIIDEEAANDRAYDEATQHGLRQGVVLR